MVQVTRSVLIDRPPAQAFATMGDPKQDPRWLGPIVTDVRQTSAGPWGVGSTIVGSARVLGRRLAVPNMIAEYEPNRKIVIQPTAGPIRLSAVRTVEPVASGSQATITGLGSSMTCTSS
jgi:uncharacterized protein YndB with AHSA1/START domain